MIAPFEITSNDIEALSDIQLTSLLHVLLILEANKLGLPKTKVSVSLKIDTPDGGEDGRIEWEDGPDPARWIPHRLTLFQIKATQMGPADCRLEVLRATKDGTTSLKPRVQDIVERAGAYVLCYGRHCEGSHIDSRITEIRKAFASCVGSVVADAVTIQVYGAERLATWSNEYASTIVFIKRCIGRSVPADMQTWNDWRKYHQTQLSYYADETRRDVLAKLRVHLRQRGAIARVAALSGLGKSRLGLELFRPPVDRTGDPEQVALSRSCVYISDGARSEDDIRQAMLVFQEHNVRATVVVDECPLDVHQKLEAIAAAEGSTISLLTLDFDPSSDPRSSRCQFFRMCQLSDNDMNELLSQSGVRIPKEHLAKVAEFADGFPRMAELMADAVKAGQSHLWELAPTTLVEKLVVRRSRQPDQVLTIAKALAIFEHLGVDGIAKPQLQAFSQHICDCDVNHAYSIIRELETAGIAYRRGDYVRLTPLPIAVALAGEWWNGCDPDRATELLLGDLLPSEMVDATANQLARLSGHMWVKKLVGRIYGPDGRFRQRDRLDSARGSRLASSLAEVNPRAVCDALMHAFGSMSVEEALEVQTGRRDLVWCLEKLAWWPDTFEDAAWLLLLLAAGENESWGNNATNQIASLFQVLLGGTEVPASQRLTVLERAMGVANSNMDRVVVGALKRALASQHFIRDGGPEAQGGGLPRKDWRPATYREIWDYWRDVLHLLEAYVGRDDAVGESAEGAIGCNVRGMVLWGGLHVVEEFVARTRTLRCEWPKLMDGLRSAQNCDGSQYPEAVRMRINALVRELEPTHLDGRLRQIVSMPSWHQYRNEPDGITVNVSEERARNLAQELAHDLHFLLPLLPSILTGEQRQGFTFGRALAGGVPNALSLLTMTVDAMRSVGVDKRNPSFAMGVARGSAEQERVLTREFLRRLLDDPALQVNAVDMLLAIDVNDSDVELIATRIAGGELPPSVAAGFAFGRVLDSLRVETVTVLISACVGGAAQGPLVALELMGMYCFQRDPNERLLSVMKSLLLHPDVITQVRSNGGGMAGYEFVKLAKAYLNATGDNDFAASLVKCLIESISSEEDCSLMGREFMDLVTYCLEHHVEAVWPPIRLAMMREGLVAYSVRVTLEELDLVALVGEERLLSWCDTEPVARAWVARIMRPLLSEEANETGRMYPSWSPFAVMVLDRYGSEPAVLSSVAARIYSGSWCGSAVPRLVGHRSAFAELKSHRNPVVAQWALDCVAGLDKEIEVERKRDEEMDFGIWRRS